MCDEQSFLAFAPEKSCVRPSIHQVSSPSIAPPQNRVTKSRTGQNTRNRESCRQSALQRHKFCVSHKTTHLFGADVLTHKDCPRNWNTWDRNLCSDFNDTTSHFLAPLASNNTIPEHSALIATMTKYQTRRAGNPTSEIHSHPRIFPDNEAQHTVCHRRHLDTHSHTNHSSTRTRASFVQ